MRKTSSFVIYSNLKRESSVKLFLEMAKKHKPVALIYLMAGAH